MDTDEFCRLCLKEDTLYHNLLESNFSQMLDTLTNIKVTKEDDITTSVCTPCLELLKSAYSIQQKFINANKRLEEKLKLNVKNSDSNQPKTTTECVYIKEEVMEITGDSESSQTPTVTEENPVHLPTIHILSSVQRDKSFVCMFCGEDLKNQTDLAWHRYKRHSLRQRRNSPPLNLLPKTVIEKMSEQAERERIAKNQALKTMAEETRKFYESLNKKMENEDEDDDYMAQKKFCPRILKRKRISSMEPNDKQSSID